MCIEVFEVVVSSPFCIVAVAGLNNAFVGGEVRVGVSVGGAHKIV